LLLISCSFSKQTPLHIAASEGHIEIVQLLLSSNAAIDARDFRYFLTTPALLIENALLMFCCVAPLTFASHFLFLQQPDPAAHRRR
jgi:ankyrin repeat protein